MAKKQFSVEVLADSTIEIEVAAIDSEKYDIGKMKEEDVDALMNDSEYIVQCGLGDEWDGRFELKVYNENDRVVFKSNDFSDFRFIVQSDVTEDEDFPTSVDPKNATMVWEKRWTEDGNGQEPGIYAVRRHSPQRVWFNFVVEDEKFDPSKLLFVSNRKLKGLFYDYMSDPYHVFYGDKFVEAEVNEDYSEYGYTDFIMEKTEKGWWEEIREI